MKKYTLTIVSEAEEVQSFTVEASVVNFLLMFADSTTTENLEKVYHLNNVNFVLSEIQEMKMTIKGDA